MKAQQDAYVSYLLYFLRMLVSGAAIYFAVFSIL
jgi:hypothetical protein